MQLDVNALGEMIADLIAETVEPFKKEIQVLRGQIDALEKRQPEKGRDGKDGVDGKSITVDDLAPLIGAQVKAAVEAMPKPQDGKDGKDGLDAPPIEIDASDIVKQMLAGDEVKNLVVLEVSAYLHDNPPPAGKDGLAGKSITVDDVAPLIAEKVKTAVDAIPKPQDGEDGAGIADLLIDRDGALTATFTDGRMKSLGVIVGKDGAPGRDGADFTDFDMDYDGERTITIKSKNGVITKRLPLPVPKGYWKEGLFCEKADIVTHNGTAYIAKRDTSSEPKSENCADWDVFARKGIDGKHGRNGIDKTASVKLNA